MYPAEYDEESPVTVELTPGGILCPRLTLTDTSCTTTITSNTLYNISLTVSNDIGISEVGGMFDCEFKMDTKRGLY